MIESAITISKSTLSSFIDLSDQEDAERLDPKELENEGEDSAARIAAFRQIGRAHV